MLEELCKRIQHCCPNYASTFSDHGTKDILEVVGSKNWPVSNLGQQFPTTRNDMEKGLQTDATCNIQQSWELLAKNAASVCMGLKASYVRTVQDSFCASLCNDPPPPQRWGLYIGYFRAGTKTIQQNRASILQAWPRIWTQEYREQNQLAVRVGSELGPQACKFSALTTRPHSLLRLTLKQVTNLDSNQPTASTVFYTCAQPYHPSSGSHGHAAVSHSAQQEALDSQSNSIPVEHSVRQPFGGSVSIREIFNNRTKNSINIKLF